MEWHPSKFFQSAYLSDPYALLILHHPLNARVYHKLKKHACFIICADGGANNLYDLIKNDPQPSDLDSIDPYVREHFERLNVEIIKESEQYSTDFTKCLRYLKNNFENIISSSPAFSADHENFPRKQQRYLDIVVLGGLGGRVDQAFSQIHSLYTASQSTADKPPGDLYLISEESISFLLCEGRNTILTPGGGALESRKKFASGLEFTECCFSENVGIIPVGGTSVINTKGFEWDVRDWETKFGGQLSTSNHIRADAVEVNTTIPVLFTMELADWLKCTECPVFAESHQ